VLALTFALDYQQAYPQKDPQFQDQHLPPAPFDWGDRGCAMTEEQSRAAEYLNRAAKMRQLAGQTRYSEVRTRLLWMAAGFERLADQVETWEEARLAAD
jgi:hypothetical protein